MESLFSYFENMNVLQWMILGTALLAVWFLPAALALMFNRKHFKLILIACVPAGFSVIAWSGLMVWATTGNMLDKYKAKNQLKPNTVKDSQTV